MNTTMLTMKNDEFKRKKALVGEEAGKWQAAFEDEEVADLVRRGQLREIFDQEEIQNIPANKFIGVLIRCTTKRDNEGKEIRKRYEQCCGGI